MNINELKINNENLQILKYNYVLYRNPMDVLTFYKFFDDCINEKDKTISMEIGNKTISNKDFILYNLLDIQSILDSVKYKKGSLLYEYISSYITDNCEDNQKIEEFLETFYRNILNKCEIDLGLIFEENISKIFQNTFDVIPIIKNREETINKLLRYIVKNTINKRIIIFINSDLIKIDINEFDNVIVFDINNKLHLNFYNVILYNEKIANFNLERLMNGLEINWPIQFNKEIVNNWLNYFFKTCFSKYDLFINNDELLIVSSLVNKLMELNMKISFETDKISNIIKSFLADL